jgi:predicted dehydrogenase
MKTYNIGIIGYGGFGKFLHHWWSKLEGIKVTAVSDRSLKDESSQEFTIYSQWQDLLKNPRIDIVSIATPPALHVDIACEAMRAGKHVLLEKPVALDTAGADKISRIQRETGKVILVDHMLRYNPLLSTLVRLSKQKTFGELRHAVVANYAQDESLPPDHWFWDRSLSGGILIEHGVHFFDIINALTDQEVIEVRGFSHARNPGQQDQVSATVLYNHGLIANHYHSFSGPGFFEETKISLMYDLAKIELTGWIPMKGTIRLLSDEAFSDTLGRFPGLKIQTVEGIAEAGDISRPEGWGEAPISSNNEIKAAGISYQVSKFVSASFEIPDTKSSVYGQCLQSILKDLVSKVEDPDFQPLVSFEDAYLSLKIAEEASR